MNLFGRSHRNAMRVAKVSQGSFFYTPVKKDETALRMRGRREQGCQAAAAFPNATCSLELRRRAMPLT
jgi:hypothetical protein